MRTSGRSVSREDGLRSEVYVPPRTTLRTLVTGPIRSELDRSDCDAMDAAYGDY